VHKDKIRSRITERRREIKDELERLKTQDENRLQIRLRENPFSMALIGYTNAGKSSLFNGLLGRHEVDVENLLFKTLDTTTRALELSLQSRILITDTVGFIQKLPPHLEEAFTTTLSESQICSHLLILLDPVGMPLEIQQQVLRETLAKIGRTDEENWFWVLNKVDLFDSREKANQICKTLSIEYQVSATSDDSVQELKESIVEKLFAMLRQETLYLDYEEYGKLHGLREIATLEEEPAYFGTHLELRISFPNENTHRIEKVFGRSLDELTQPKN
jgi:GTP-binding protein HflX